MYLLALSLLLAPGLASARTFDIAVGLDGRLNFQPSQVTAGVGDKLDFHFYPKNHSVAVSSFNKPCVPIEADGGLFSGFRPTQTNDPTVFEVTINDTKPLWIYCSQVKHCQAGMSMVVNQGSGAESLGAYQSAARQVIISESPSQIAGGIFRTNTSTTGNNTSSASPTGTSIKPPSPSFTGEAGRTGVEMGMIGALGAVAVGAFAAGMI